MRILVTGGAGFIGSHLVRRLLREPSVEVEVINLDKLTYAGNLESLREVLDDPRHVFIQADLREPEAVRQVIRSHPPDAIMHLATESHVDRSIETPGEFIQTNIVGTFNLLQAAREHHESLAGTRKDRFRFLQVSTDEVYGALGPEGVFREETPYNPSSPYSASKAAADHLARAWHHTYGLPVLITHGSNNYGPCQFPEKLVPLVILKALHGEAIPVYGDGQNVRDWIYVEDHVAALEVVLAQGRIGETYNIGGGEEHTNLELVQLLCAILDELRPRADGRRHEERIRFVPDRAGHDFRYALDTTKVREQLGWRPREPFLAGLRRTVVWYLEHPTWWQNLRSGHQPPARAGVGAPVQSDAPISP